MGVLAPFSSLLDSILPPRAEAKLVRDADAGALRELMAPSVIGLGGFECVGLVPFREPLMRAAVHEWKYRANRKALALLSSLLAEYLLSEDGGSELIIIPMPLSERRRRERGFNQCETVANDALAAIRLPRISLAPSLIRRVRDTEHQARLKRRERAENVRGAFAAAGDADGAATYLLLDDVVTTGATLYAAAEALRAAGARHILSIALAY